MIGGSACWKLYNVCAVLGRACAIGLNGQQRVFRVWVKFFHFDPIITKQSDLLHKPSIETSHKPFEIGLLFGSPGGIDMLRVLH